MRKKAFSLTDLRVPVPAGCVTGVPAGQLPRFPTQRLTGLVLAGCLVRTTARGSEALGPALMARQPMRWMMIS